MKSSVKIILSVLILLFGTVFADCLYGFLFGGEFGLYAFLVVLFVGALLSLASVMMIFSKEERQMKKARTIFAIMLLCFVIVCLYGYRPLNYISGSDDYTEQSVTVVDQYVYGRNFHFIQPQSVVTVEDEDGNVFDIDDYAILADYGEGEKVFVREYTGGFNLKYYVIVKMNK